MSLSRVVFPEPLGPMMARKSPSRIARLTSTRTGSPAVAERYVLDLEKRPGSAAAESMFEILQVLPHQLEEGHAGLDWSGSRLWPGFRTRTSAPISRAISRAILSLTFSSKNTVRMRSVLARSMIAASALGVGAASGLRP